MPDQVTFTITVHGEAAQLRLDLKTTRALKDVFIDGKPMKVLDKKDQWTHLILTAPRGGVLVRFEPTGHGKLEARWAIITPGWPAGSKPLPPRPTNLMPWSLSDSTVTLQSTPVAGVPALTY